MKSAFGSRSVLPPLARPRSRVRFALVRVTEYRKSLRFTLPFGPARCRVVLLLAASLVDSMVGYGDRNCHNITAVSLAAREGFP